MMKKIEFESHIPYYIQLMEIIKGKIEIGDWKPGDQIFGEQVLCRNYEISRTVVRQALKELEIEGVITRRKGRGTFIAHPKIREGLVQNLTGFYRDMMEQGLKPKTRVLHQKITACSEKVAKYLEIEAGEKVIDIQRLRFIEDQPIQLVTSYIPQTLCPLLVSADLENQSLYEFLEKETGIRIVRGHRYIEAVAANELEAKLLGIEKNAPLIMLDSISYSNDDKPVEFYHALHRGDRTRFEVEILGLKN
jgi:GntR family transcriptional regulator